MLPRQQQSTNHIRMSHRTTCTRRDFLKSGALTAVAAMAPGALLASRPQSNKPIAGLPQRIDAWEYHANAVGGIWEVWRGDKEGDQAEARRWTRVNVPHCFNARDGVDPDQPYYQGPGWYRTGLKIANPFPRGRTLLHFEGAGQKCEVFVYLDEVGRHIGGYDEFAVDITDPAASFLRSHTTEEIPIAVLCDNSPDLEMIPSGLSDFNRYGGLYRHVNLIYVPAISLDRVHVSPTVNAEGRAEISIKARLYNPGSLKDEIQLSLRIISPSGATVFAHSQQLEPWQGEHLLATCAIEKPELWSPARPTLYRCEVTLDGPSGAMEVSERFGLRYFDFLAHGPFKLNGERLLLRGTHRHEDHAGLGAAMPDSLIRQEMELIKNAGVNFIRLGHYQQSRLVLDLCDELGLLVWEEIPWCRGGLGGERYQQQAKNMLNAMIDQHYNHPSIVIWGLGDELDWPGDAPVFDAGKIRSFVKELNDQAHALDVGRKTALRRCDFCKEIVDVYSPSLWMGWLYGRYTDYKDSCQKEMEKVDHFLHMEWGGESHARRHSEDVDRMVLTTAESIKTGVAPQSLQSGKQGSPSRDGDFSENYVCNLLDWYLKEQETMPWLAGAAQWAFKDFATPQRSDNPVPHMNQKGLVERDLTPKESYYVVQSYWAEKPMIHIYGHSWQVRWGNADEEKLVKVYANCETAELFLNGKSCGVKKRNSQDFPAAGLRWMVKLRAGENHLRAIGRMSGVAVTDETSLLYQTTRWEKPARLELKETYRTSNTVSIEARLLDQHGTLCLDARNRVRFGIAGNGTLLDNLGTSSGSRSVELYNGRAGIKLMRNGGASVASVSADAIPTAFLTIA
jgi:beta-galactosidase